MWLSEITEPAKAKESLANPTVADIADTWFAEHQATLHPSEIGPLKITIRSLKALCGRVMAKDFDVPALKAFRAGIVEGAWDDREGLSPRTANSRVKRVRSIWRWAEEEKLVPKGSWEHLRALKPLRCGPRKPRSTTLEDIEKVAGCVPTAVGDMLRLQYWTGMRPGEVRLMQWVEIDGDVYTPNGHKNDWREQGRAVVLCKDALAILDKYRGKAGYLFQTRKGKPYGDNLYGLTVRRGCKRAGVKLVPYSGRHACKDRIKTHTRAGCRPRRVGPNVNSNH